MQYEQADAVIIGAGVIGLAVGRALALTGREVVLLEAHPAIGMETSSRNSEVIHAGLYYPPGSLKARSCVEGNKALYRYCKSRGIPQQQPGKLIVANTGEQLERLKELQRNAIDCGVNKLQWREHNDVKALEPELEAEAALFSPSTGIIDAHALMLALQADIESSGGTIIPNSRVSGGYAEHGGICLQVVSGDETWLQARTVVNAAGLSASQVARSIPDVPDLHIPETHYVKGHYFTYTDASPFSHLVYPLPEKGGLGIHATMDQSGQLRFGPDAQDSKQLDYRFETGRKEAFVTSIRQWFPALDPDKLQPGYVGVRPKLVANKDGFADFKISGPKDHGVNGLVNLFGIESPGLTACLALADDVVRTHLE